MNRIIATSALLALVAGSASAASTQMHERHGTFPDSVTATQTARVPASKVYSGKELDRAGLSANAVVTVTVFPTTDAPSTRRHES